MPDYARSLLYVCFGCYLVTIHAMIRTMRIMLVFGTRPEAIKMCPLVLELKKHKGFEVAVCLTGQHREMLADVTRAFQVHADVNLDIMKDRQTLTDITSDVLLGMENVLKERNPDLVLVHGDTTTALATAMASFYQRIPVGHVEAGLRSGNMYSPYPEEMNRMMVDRLSHLCFAPTKGNREKLLREGINDNVFVTGNTVIDSFATTVRDDYVFHEPTLREITRENKKRIVLLTAHRRENLGEPIEIICQAVLQLLQTFEDVHVIYPVHPNPAVREPVYRILGNTERISLLSPLDVFDMHNLISRCHMVLTDSGGLQEEAPAFGKPVLVLRKETERPEAVEAGTVRMAGVETEPIVRLASQILSDDSAYQQMAHAVNPYGDGHASERIAECIKRVDL